MTGVGTWAMELTKATARLGADRGDWNVAAITLATPSFSGKRTPPGSILPASGRGFSFFPPPEGAPVTPVPQRLTPRIEDEFERIERSWAEAAPLLRVPVPYDYEEHPRSDLWFHGGGLFRLLKDLRADLFFSPTFLTPLRAPCPRVATLLDFIAWRHPQTYPARFRYFVRLSTRLAASRAEALVALSQSVRSDARILLHIPRKKVRVIYPGVSREFRPMPEGELVAVRTAHGLPAPPYFIWVGAIERRKDLPTLLKAFERLLRARQASKETGNRPPVSLLIVGRRAAGGDRAVARLQNSQARESIRWVADLPRGLLAAAVAGATALVYPSRYEGFGLPVAEALACETPVIASNTSSIPEVAGEAALLVPPGNSRALQEAMSRILDSPDLAGELARKGREQAREFRWDRSASHLLALADKVLKRQIPDPR